MDKQRIALVGDYSPNVRAHRAIPLALERAAAETGVAVEPVWMPTPRLADDAAAGLAGCAGLWCVPGSPYASMDGALAAIRYAREQGVPFLSTCGGFQHALIEYARDVLDLAAADHAESNPDAALPWISPLACSLVGERGTIRLAPGSRIHAIYGADETVEEYHCRYGLNPEYRARLAAGPLQITGLDANDEVRVVESPGHPFFVATLFQPELSALAGRTHPLIVAYVRALAAVPARAGV